MINKVHTLYEKGGRCLDEVFHSRKAHNGSIRITFKDKHTLREIFGEYITYDGYGGIADHMRNLIDTSDKIEYWAEISVENVEGWHRGRYGYEVDMSLRTPDGRYTGYSYVWPAKLFCVANSKEYKNLYVD